VISGGLEFARFAFHTQRLASLEVTTFKHCLMFTRVLFLDYLYTFVFGTEKCVCVCS